MLPKITQVAAPVLAPATSTENTAGKVIVPVITAPSPACVSMDVNAAASANGAKSSSTNGPEVV